MNPFNSLLILKRNSVKPFKIDKNPSVKKAANSAASVPCWQPVACVTRAERTKLHRQVLCVRLNVKQARRSGGAVKESARPTEVVSTGGLTPGGEMWRWETDVRRAGTGKKHTHTHNQNPSNQDENLQRAEGGNRQKVVLPVGGGGRRAALGRQDVYCR